MDPITILGAAKTLKDIDASAKNDTQSASANSQYTGPKNVTFNAPANDFNMSLALPIIGIVAVLILIKGR